MEFGSQSNGFNIAVQFKKKIVMELIKLKAKLDGEQRPQSEIIVKSFIQSCINLDTSIFEPFIQDDQLFDDKDKYRFLAFLKAQFDSARKMGLTETIVKQGRCQLCIMGHQTFEFWGEGDKLRFAYVIEKKDGEVKNIFNCNASSGWFIIPPISRTVFQ